MGEKEREWKRQRWKESRKGIQGKWRENGGDKEVEKEGMEETEREKMRE